MTLDLSIEERIRKFIEETFLAGAELEPVNGDESFLENGIIDSTGVLELIGFLEETFHIQVMDEEIVPDNLDSITKVVSYLSRKTES